MEVDSEENALEDLEFRDFLNQAGGFAAGVETSDDASVSASGGGLAASSDDGMSVDARAKRLLDEVDAGLEEAVQGRPRQSRPVRSGTNDAVPFEFADLGSDVANGSEKDLSAGTSDDAQLDVQIEFGQTELLAEEVRSLREGVVVPLDKLAGDPVDVVVNGQLVARGEVLVLNDRFCVRVAELLAADR